MTARRPFLLRRQALALEPRFLLDAAVTATVAKVVDATDTKPGVAANGATATVTVDEHSGAQTVDLFSGVAVHTDTGNQDGLNKLVVTVDRSGANQALVADGSEIALTAGSGTTAGNHYVYSVQVAGDGSTTITFTIASSETGNTPQGAADLIDSMAFRTRDNTAESGTVNVMLKSLSDDGNDVADLDIGATVHITSNINVAPVLTGDGHLDARESLSPGDLGSATEVAYSTDGKFAYVAGTDGIQVYKVDATGALAAVQTFTHGDLNTVSHMVISADGKSIYTTSSDDDNYVVHLQVAADGTLSYVSSVTSDNGVINGGMAMSDDGKYLYVGTQWNNVVIYQRDAASGDLSIIGRAGAGSGRSGMIATAGDYVYVMSLGMPHELVVYQRDPNGQLNTIENLPVGDVGSGYSPVDYAMAVSADGTHLYIGNPVDGTIHVYQLQNGTLSLVGTETPGSVRGIALSAEGSTLYATGADGRVYVYGVAANGTLALAGDIAGSGSGSDVAVSHDGTSVLVAGGNVIRYTGVRTLTAGEALPFADGLTLSDSNYDVLDGGAGNYQGATLTIVANVETGSFGFASANGLSLSGNSVMLDGHAIATYAHNGDTLTISFTAAASKAVVNQVLHQITYSNSAARNGLITLTVHGTDSALDSNAVVVSLLPNTIPQADAHSTYTLDRATTETPYHVTLPEGLFSDADGDTLTWSVSGLPDGLTFDPATRTISGTASDAGTRSVTVTVKDVYGASASVTLNLVIGQIENRAPTVSENAPAALAPATVGTGYSVTLNGALFSDADSRYGDTLTWSVSGLPAGLVFDAATLTLSGTVSALGNYTVTLAATDASGARATHDVVLRVLTQAEADNHAPALNADADKVVYTSDGTLSGYSYYVNSIATSADGSLVIIAGSTGASVVGGNSSQGDNFLSVYHRDASTGKLTLLQTFRQGTTDDGDAANGIEVNGLSAITAITLSGDGKFLYAAGYGSTGDATHYAMSIFSVNADGTLSHVGSAANVNQKIVDVAMSSDGKQVIALSTTTIYSYTVGDDGALTLKQSLVPLYSGGFNAVAKDLDVDANGTVYAISNGRMAVYTYDTDTGDLTYRGTLQNSGGIVFRQYDSTGTPVQSLQVSTSTTFGTSYSMAASGDGNVYIATYNNYTVLALKYDVTTNTMTFVQAVTTTSPPNYPTSVETSADGTMLYVGYGFSSDINAYRIGEDGQLTLVQTLTTGLNRVYRILAGENGDLYVGNFQSNGSTGLGLVSATDAVRGTYLEGETAHPADGLTLSDAEFDALSNGAGNYKGATITLAREGGASESDAFGFTEGNGLTLRDGKILLNGTAIATFSNDGHALSIFFTADTSSATATAVLRQISYTNGSQAPGDAIHLTLAVKDEYTATTATLQLAVTQVNDAPVASATAAGGRQSPGGTAVDLFSDVHISTVEPDQTITAITLTVGGLRDGASETLRIDGQDIALVAGSGTTTGGYGYVVTIDGQTATVTLTRTGGMTADAATTLINGLAYTNTNANATLGERTVTLHSIQDSGGTDNGGHDTAILDLATHVTLSNDAPALGAETGSLTYEEVVKAIAADGYSNLFEGIQDAAVSGQYVYVVRTANVWDSSTFSSVEVSSLYVMRHAADGTLTLVQTFDSKSVSALGGAADVRVSADGASIYVIGTKGVAVFTRDNDGALVAAGAIGADLIAAHGLIRDVVAGSDGKVYVTAGNSLLVYGRGEDGSLSVLQTLQDAGDTGLQLDGANAMALSADGRFLFVATSGGTTLASVFSVGQDGQLSFIMATQGKSPAQGQLYYAKSLTLSADGGTLYAIDYDGTDYRLYTLAVGADGTMTAQADTVLDGAASHVIASPDGALLLVVGTDGIALYTRGADGLPVRAGTLNGLDGKDFGELRGATLSADGTQLYLSGTMDWEDGLIVANLKPASSTYTEGGDAVALLPGGTLADAQLDVKNGGAGDYNGASIVVEREGGADTRDAFGFLASDGYTLDAANGRILSNGTAIASITQADGKLTITFIASTTHAEAQQVLRRIAYTNTSADPTRDGAQALFKITLNDGDGHSGSLTAQLELEGVNDPPVIDTTPLTPTYPAEGEPVKLFEGTTIDTVEAGQTVWQVIVTVSPASAQDVLGVDGGRIPLNQATDGTATTGTGLSYKVSIANGVTTVILYVNNTPERAAKVIDSLTYSHNGDASSSSSSVTIGVNVRENADENALSSHTSSAVVRLAAASGVNTAPTLGGGANAGYTERSDAIAIAPNATVADTQMDAYNGGAGNYNGSVLTLALGAGATSADSLGLANGNGLTRSGDQLLKDGKLIGRISVSGGTLTIAFTDEAGVVPTRTDVQNALRQITYANSSHAPVEGVAVSVTLADQRGLVSSTLAFEIDITAVNDLPVVGTDPVLSLGDLSHVQQLAGIAGLSTLTSSVATADGSHLYVADDSGAIALFSLDAASGELTLVRVLAAGNGLDGVKDLSLSADGKNLYALRKDGNAIAWFGVGADGALTYGGVIVSVYEVDGSTLFGMRDIALSADGKNLYVINDYTVLTLARDTATGALTYVGGLTGDMWSAPYLWAPTAVVVRDDLVYVVTDASNGSSLIVYQRGEAGALTLLGYVTHSQADAAGETLSLSGLQHVTVSADGRTVFVSSGTQIDAFRLDTATGALTHAGVFATGLEIRDMALTADGRALYATLADGSMKYYATANGALVATQSGMPGAGHIVLLPDGGIIVLGDAVEVLSAPPAAQPSGVIGGDPVALAPAVKLSDAELDAAANGAGDYQGASVAFAGQAGDRYAFLASGGYTLDADGKTILLNGNAVATLDQSGGNATLTYTAAITTEQANAILHRVGYLGGGDTVGTRTVSLRLNDGEADSAAYTVEVSLALPNQAPQPGDADYDPAPVTQGREYTLVLPESLFTDPENDTLAWAVSGLPQGLSFDAATRTISGTTSAALNRYTLTVTVTDPSGNTASRTLSLVVAEAPNSEPVDSGIALSPSQPQAGVAYRYTLPEALFTDPDGDTLAWHVTGLPEGLHFDATTHTLYGIATTAGQYDIVISATDPSGSSASRALALTVAATSVTPTPDPGTGTPDGGSTGAPGGHTTDDVPTALPLMQRIPSVPEEAPQDPQQRNDTLLGAVDRPAGAPQPDAVDRAPDSPVPHTPPGRVQSGSAVLLDSPLTDSLERDERWAHGLAMRTADGRPTALVALAGPGVDLLAGPDHPVTGNWHYDRDGNRHVFALPAGLVRSNSPIASIALHMAGGGDLPAGVRLDTTRGMIVAPGITGARDLSLQLVVRTTDGKQISVPIAISAERHGMATPAAPQAAGAAQADDNALGAGHKPALSQALRNSAAQDILSQARQMLAALGDVPPTAHAPLASELAAGIRQAPSITVES